ncbi:CHAD domain-containing protein [Methanorbis rubei]|uniref:CHAD domain-containing protein n=1 Tax=Methanorbis rubei TaxID=3028300 RepID=A0AAE4SC20_9EURY|nr:hypothetical protein [Methanocorpusculaceae archaeon Cs1]
MTTDIDEGYRLYGAKALLQLAADMAGESAGVKAGTDIEYIHRMRVASRRLRAALPLFAGCFGEKEYRAWEKEVKQITRSLGRARDLDVQIAFLRSYLEKLPKTALPDGMPRFLPLEYQELLNPQQNEIPLLPEPKVPAEEEQTGLFVRIKRFFAGVPEVPELPKIQEPELPKEQQMGPELRAGIECLTLRLMQERAGLQGDVIKAVEAFEQSKTVESIQKTCMEIVIHGKMEKTETKTPFSYREAYYNLSLCRENVFLYAKALADPERVAAHHEMRIAAKKLRYTMESYKDLYGDGLALAIRMVKELQDYLGDMHDCDVWTEFLPIFLKEEEEKSIAYFGNTAFVAAVRPGLENLEVDRAEKRSKLHADVNVFWKKNEGLWDQFEKNLIKPLEDLRLQTLSLPKGVASIAFFADIHANLPALSAIIADAKSRGCETFIYAGDVIGFGPFPEQTMRTLASANANGVCGNAEEAILLAGKVKECPKEFDPRRFVLHKKTWKKLSPASRAELAGLPAEIRFLWENLRIVVVHHPKSFENVCSETSDAQLEQLAAETDADVIICGHTHRPFAKKVHGVWITNTGGGGRSGDGDLRASYLLATKDPFTLHHIRVPYNIEETLARLAKNKELTAMFGAGLDFDEAADAAAGNMPELTKMPQTVSVTSAEEDK